MKPSRTFTLVATALSAATTTFAADLSLETAPPVVVKTIPVSGATGVDPMLAEIQVTYSKVMQDGSWSWSTWGEENYPETAGPPHYLADRRTCVLPVKLLPGRFYAIWLNSDRFKNFKDTGGHPAVPYLLTFKTGGEGTIKATPATPVVTADWQKRLNDSQRAVLAWTDRQFRSFFDQRTFAGRSEQERVDLEQRLLDTLNGPRTREYYQAINSLAALGSTNALPALRALAFDRRDKDNRDRWMAIRALGILDDKSAIPALIPLIYHGNANTHWWAQISLVRLTGRDFGSDWSAWGKWWNDSGGQPLYDPEIIRWWDGQPEDAKLAESLAGNDRKFLDSISATATPKPENPAP